MSNHPTITDQEMEEARRENRRLLMKLAMSNAERIQALENAFEQLTGKPVPRLIN